ncbi:MAG: hypothetical protein EB084_19950 [Proteobacteria bacterium]|nr:hypothetical protein [Pseudomonadota bacterium]
MDAEEQLRALLGAFSPGQQRKMKARAYWAARRQKRRHALGQRLCPITLAPLRALQDPVVASDGAVYERRALEQWAQRSATSPLTRLPLEYGVGLDAAARGLRGFKPRGATSRS